MWFSPSDIKHFPIFLHPFRVSDKSKFSGIILEIYVLRKTTLSGSIWLRAVAFSQSPESLRGLIREQEVKSYTCTTELAFRRFRV